MPSASCPGMGDQESVPFTPLLLTFGSTIISPLGNAKVPMVWGWWIGSVAVTMQSKV